MTEEFPTVSIIVPVYNGGHLIGDCLDSLLKLNYPVDRYEISVVENNSTDNTTAVVSGYPVILLSCSPRGPAAARNAGIARSQSDIIAFTDADCRAEPNWLMELVRPYTDPSTGATCGDIRSFPRVNGDILDQFYHDNPPLVNYQSGEHEFLPHLYTANASYRREALQTLGGFNPALVTAEDVDLSWRLQLETHWQVVFAPQAVIYHHHRFTLNGLCRQYRQYGYGEVLLDTMYRHYPGYPRSRWFQFCRMAAQCSRLPVYLLSIFLRRIRYWRGNASRYDLDKPRLSLFVESSNLLGKLDALWDTRLMTNSTPALKRDPSGKIKKFY